jgi:hypothetical protein
MQSDAQMAVSRHHPEFRRFRRVVATGVCTAVYMQHRRVKQSRYIGLYDLLEAGTAGNTIDRYQFFIS